MLSDGKSNHNQAGGALAPSTTPKYFLFSPGDDRERSSLNGNSVQREAIEELKD